MGVSPARAIAFDVLRRVEAEGAYASDLLHAELGPELTPNDAALATELVLGVLRWRRLLDFLLAGRLKKPKTGGTGHTTPERAVQHLDLPVALALRIGLYQLRFLDRIPARAAVNESVELVKRARKGSAAALVNAVLRRFADRKPANSTGIEQVLPNGLPVAERLAIVHSHPTWLVERWLARFGEQRTLTLLDANNRAPRLSCTIHDVEHHAEILKELAKAGLTLAPGVLLENVVATSGGSVTATEPFRHGAISVQDEASQAVPLLLDVRPGDRVLDLCAAPGGKTPPLSQAAGSSGIIVAADRHEHRLRAMRRQFERLHLQSVHILELDAERPLPFRAPFDRILVDAPCSGTGTLARHPEIRWRLKPEQLDEFHRLQGAILTSALEALAPGGRLVYSTCSLEPDENEEVVAEVMRAAPDVRILPTAETSVALAQRLTAGVDAAALFDASSYFRTFPGMHPTDGFFAAVLEKQSS